MMCVTYIHETHKNPCDPSCEEEESSYQDQKLLESLILILLPRLFSFRRNPLPILFDYIFTHLQVTYAQRSFNIQLSGAEATVRSLKSYCKYIPQDFFCVGCRGSLAIHGSALVSSVVPSLVFILVLWFFLLILCESVPMCAVCLGLVTSPAATLVQSCDDGNCTYIYTLLYHHHLTATHTHALHIHTE